MTKKENNQAEKTVHNEQPVSILGQFIKDLSFENPDPISFLADPSVQPSMNMDVQVDVHNLKQDHYEVVLKLKLTAKHKEKTIFLSELSYSTIVYVNEEVIGKDNINPILLVHVPHLSFPFVRVILFNLIRDGGLPAFAIHPIDFGALYEQNLQGKKDQTIQ